MWSVTVQVNFPLAFSCRSWGGLIVGFSQQYHRYISDLFLSTVKIKKESIVTPRNILMALNFAYSLLA